MKNFSVPVISPNGIVSRYIIHTAIAGAALTMAACASPEQRVERYSQEGQEFLEQGDYGKANIQFRNALKINEEHVPSLVGLATIVEERQDFQGMFGILQRIVRLDPSQLEAHVKLGKLYLIGSDEATALEHAEKALEIDPDHHGALALKAAIQLKAGDTIGAVELATRVYESDPGNAEAATVLVTERAGAGDSEAALSILEASLAEDPEMAVLQLLRIQLLKNLGRDDEAREAYSEIIELFPEEPAYRRVYASELVNADDFTGAQTQLEAVAALEPENDDAKLDVIRIIYANSSGGEEAAQTKFLSYLEAAPENFDLRFDYVDFLREIDDEQAAAEELEKLASSDDMDVQLRAKNEIAETFFGAEEWEKVEALVTEILSFDEANTAALVKRANLKIRDGEYDKAIIDLRAALDDSPDLPEALISMAMAFERQGSISSARAELARAYDASNRNPRITRVFAQFLIQQGDANRAEEVLEGSLAAFPGDIENLRMLASVRLSLQDWNGAEEVAQLIENIEGESDGVNAIRSAAFSGLGDFDRVIETLSARSEQAPLESRPLSTLVSAYIQSERFDEAEALLKRIISGDGETYAARILLAQVYAIRDGDAAAVAALNEAVSAEPAEPAAYELLYRHYLLSGQPEEALRLIDEGLTKSPDSVALRIFKADLYLGNSAYEDAFEIYAALVDIRPNDPLIVNNYVSLSSDLRLDQESIQKALELTALLERIDNPAFNDTIGWANYRAGNYEKAVEFISKAAASAGENAEILYHLGAAQLRSGDADQARLNLDKALAAGGENFRFESEVRDLLQQL